ncbi:hypothetical protein Tco_1372905, partial [Tanacetum coccineum]
PKLKNLYALGGEYKEKKRFLAKVQDVRHTYNIVLGLKDFKMIVRVTIAQKVILNGNKVLKRTVGEVEQIYEPTSAEEKQDRRNEMKARETLLMALPNKDQLKFHSYKDAKLIMEAIEKRLQKLIGQLEIQGEVLEQEDMNLKLLRSLPSEWNTHDLIWRNKEEIETISLDDFTSSTNEANNTAYGVSTAHTQEQIDPDDLEEMDLQWEIAMLTIRARRAPKHQENKGRENGRRTITVETPTENTLIAQDGIGGYDWNEKVEGESVDVVSNVTSSDVKTVESNHESVDVKS